ncbi:MAG: PEGA domain-containing protein [Methanoregula sp.]|nr:PEGA domain-containing protein [Methanoregula sp.]
MSRTAPMLLVPAISLLIFGILSAGCSDPGPLQASPENGTLQVSSVPPGAELWLDKEYRGLTPAAISGVPAGHHTLEFRMTGYESVTYPVTVVNGGMVEIPATLIPTQVALPVTLVTTTTPSKELPEIHVDGYWTYPQGTSGTENPVLLLVHTEAFNVGSVDAREVTVSANFYTGGRMTCWNTVYLGTLAAGGHMSRDTMVSCTLPLPRSDRDLEVRFENAVVTQA